jgi:3-hydroxyacyl-CoA dehydrogenase
MMTALTNMVDYNIDDGLAILTLDNPPVNALSQGVRQGLKEGVEKALADTAVNAILIICKGRTFIAGADISEFGSGPREPDLRSVLRAIDNSSKPIIAAIHGTVLGGGLETALCCNYRVAVAEAKFGLPEVNLGLLPGGGGTQRLPRIVGVEKALAMVTTGIPIGAPEALKLGLIDKIVSGDLHAEAVAFAREKGVEGLLHPRIRDRDDRLQSARDNPEVFAAVRKMIAPKARGFIAPEYNIRCIEAAVTQPFDEGLATEEKLFMELMTGAQSKAQQYFFFSERQASKIPGIDGSTAELPIAKVGVIGGGTMGGGIAMNMANVGIPVTMIETTQAGLDRGLATIRKNYENTASKGRISLDDVEARCGLIQGSLNLEDLADCDLIIEAVFENMAVKKDIFGRLDVIAKQGAILASNTSALDLNEIAAATTRPEWVIGLHFFSPANVMKLLEVVRGDKTADPVIKTCMAFAKKIKKVAILVGVCPGFVGNRILFMRQTQASLLALEGSPVHQVDKVLYDFGFPMGAFQMADLAGLDLGWDKDLSDPTKVKDRLCGLGRLGQKAGAGFYDYDDRRRPTPASIVSDLMTECAQAQGIAQRSISDEEILDRCVLPMINEGAKILAEGIALRASDIDVCYVYGYGWPLYRGGPMHYANSLGLDVVLAKLRHYHKVTGDDFWEPSQMLVSLAEQGKHF